MALIPGVPGAPGGMAVADMSPPAISPVKGNPQFGKGTPTAIHRQAHQNAKPGKVAHVPSPFAKPPKTGDEYRKPSTKQQMIRGGTGGMRRGIREGGLGPGKMSTPGSSDNYSLNSPDSE